MIAFWICVILAAVIVGRALRHLLGLDIPYEKRVIDQLARKDRQ